MALTKTWQRVLLTVPLLFLMAAGSGATLLMEENFNYAVGQLTDNGGGANVSGGNWIDFSGTGNYIPVTAGSLSYTDYPSSGTGNKISIVSVTTSAEDVYRQFSEQSAGSNVYVSFLVNLANTNGLAADTSANGDYFVSLQPSTSTSYMVRITVKRSATSGMYLLGLRASGITGSANAVWYSSNLSPGTTYLAVFRYSLVAGDLNDTCRMWINPSLAGAEPVPDLTHVATLGTDPADIGRIAIRQAYSSGPPAIATPNADIDGIRIGTSWNDITGLNPQVSSVFPPTNAANIRPGADITVQFNRLMNASTIDTTSFRVTGQRQAIYLPDSIRPISNGSTFTYYIADSLLTRDTVTVTLKASITDTNGIPLSADYTWPFYTLVPEIIKPSIASTVPAHGSGNIKASSPIIINFSEQIDTLTVDTVAIRVLGRRVSRYQSDSVRFMNDGATVAFYPKDSLSYRDTVTVMVRAPLADYSSNLIADTSFYFSTKLNPSVPISEIQYPGGNSPLLNNIVTIEGIVTSPLLDKMSTDITFCVQDDTTAWSGIWVWDPGKAVNRGDRVRLTGTVSELYNRTTITSVNSYTVLATGQPLPPPISVTTSTVGTAGTAEAYEGVLVKVSNLVVTAIPNSYGEWTASDGSGNCKFDDASGYSYVAALGDSLRSVTGVLDYTFSEFKIQPRDGEDIIDNFAPYIKKLIATDTVLFVITNKPLNSATISDSTVNIVGNIGGARQFTMINDTALCLLRLRPTLALALSETLRLTMKGTIQDAYGATLDGNANRVSQGSPTDDYMISVVINTRALSVAEVQRPGVDGFNSAYEGQMVVVSGTLTGPDYVFTSSTSSTASWYLQDATGGANIYGGKKGNYRTLGRNYIIRGRVTEYNGVTEIAADSMIVKLGTVNSLIASRTLIYNQLLGESIEGQLASVEGTIGSIPAYAGGGYNMEMRNGNAPIAVRIAEISGFDLSPMTYGAKIRATGIVSQYDKTAPYNSGYQLVPRFAQEYFYNGVLYPPDIEILTDSIAPSASGQIVSVKPNPFSPEWGEVAEIEINAPTTDHITLRIYDLKGRLVTTIFNNVPGGHKTLLDGSVWNGTDNSNRRANIGIYIAHLRSVTAQGGISDKTKIIVLGTPLK
jgi:hypothetical protein